MKLALAWAANLLRTPLDAELAQLVEQCFRKAWVIGSNPMLGSIFRKPNTSTEVIFRGGVCFSVVADAVVGEAALEFVAQL